jgi:sulfate/thiosulfate transport system substrate-binding protein
VTIIRNDTIQGTNMDAKVQSKLIRMVALLVGLIGVSAAAQAAQTLLNVSYDPTRELYEHINSSFEAYWKKTTGETIQIKTSNGASGAQARAVVAGLEADVVTLGAASDIDALYERGNLLPENWQDRLPQQSTPYTSTIVFLVRKGNPKNIHDWLDLVRPGISVVMPNPKTSAGARWDFLAAYAFARSHYHDDAPIKAFIKSLYGHAPMLATGARAATLVFTQQGLGDVLVSWENEAFLAIKEAGSANYQIVVPSISMLAQPPVAVVDKNVERHGTAKLAEAYLRYLYTPTAQEIIAKNFYRPIDPEVAGRYASQFPKIKVVNISTFGGWRKVQKDFFDDGALFDQLF